VIGEINNKSMQSPVILAQLSAEHRELLHKIVNQGGPEPSEYSEFAAIVNNLEDQEIDYFREIIKDYLNEHTLIGHGYVKPFGYPGDFKIIHNIYKRYEHYPRVKDGHYYDPVTFYTLNENKIIVIKENMVTQFLILFCLFLFIFSVTSSSTAL
jgi:hypothetical protein